MISRPSAGTQRPQLPQRASSGGSHRSLNRPGLPSKLSNINLASQSDGYVDLTDDGESSGSGDHGLHSVINPPAQPEVIDLDAQESDTGLCDRQGAHGKEMEGGIDDTYQEEEPLPYPPKPVFLTGNARQQSRNATRAYRGQRDPARRAYGLGPPPIANKLTGHKTADFYPWCGSHPEDLLTEQVIKSGYSDKPPGPNQSESNFGRPSLWPVLKNKSGLQVLSHLLVQILDKRQNAGRCTAPSTFRPPPRVALTDTKREAWLRDLAKAEVPLRRLSRTIPHGVKGKVLLDQCIDKNIPIPRAIWLAKCVGANEIRGFKRKGVSDSAALSGELKWVKEWTVSVEQFLDSIIAGCGQPNWQAKMNYAVRLATNFFSEQLLDTEHYMDWLLGSFESASLERLPIWLVCLQIYWKHLVSQRKRGRRLAEGLLVHLHAISSLGTQQSTAPMTLRLQQLVMVLAVSHRGCLILPRTWDNYKNILVAIDPSNKPGLAEALIDLNRRNQQLARLTCAGAAVPRSPKLQLIDLLDSVRFDVQVDKLAIQAETLLSDHQTVIGTVLEWASSKYRDGHARVYLAARLLRHWKSAGLDIDEAILCTLAKSGHGQDLDRGQDIDKRSMHRILAELVRSKHFSVGRYLQWLISMGAFSGAQASGDDAQLILDIPTQDLTPNVRNLRRTLLQRLGSNPDLELQQMTSLKAELSSLLFVNDASATTAQVLPALMNMQLRGTVKLTIGQWLYEETIRLASGPPNVASKEDVRFFLPNHVFCKVRDLLEQLDDFSSLSILINAATTSTDAALLASVTDAVNMHAHALAAMGVLQELTGRLCQRQRLLRTQQSLDKVFLSTLSSLLQRVPADAAFVRALKSDMLVCEQQSSVACSPASDSMITQQPGSLEADEDISRVLASGNSMDDQLMQRMFSAIAQRAAKAGSNNDQGIAIAACWFAQLRMFDHTTFDQLAQDLMKKLAMGGADQGTVTAVSSALVGLGSMQLEVLYKAFSEQIESVRSGNPMKASKLAATSLQVLVPSSSAMHASQSPETYRFALEKELFCTGHSTEVLSLLRDLAVSLPEATSFSRVARSLCGGALVPLLRRYAVVNAEATAKELGISGPSSSISSTRLDELLTALLNVDDLPSASAGVSPLPASPMDANYQGTSAVATSTLITSATELSLPLCQLALAHAVCQPGGNTLSVRADDQSSILQSLKRAIEENRTIWPQLVNAMGQSTVQEVHHWAQTYLLDAASAYITSPHTNASLDRTSVSRYLDVARVSSSALPTDSSQGLGSLTEKLKSLESLIEGLRPFEAAKSSYDDDNSIAPTCFWISTLVQLATLQQFSDSLNPTSEHASLLSTLCSLVVQPKLQMQRLLIEQTLDVALILSDTLSSDTLTSISRNFHASARSNPSLTFLFGPTTRSDNFLALASRVHPPTQPTSAFAPANPSSSPLGLRPGQGGLPPRPPPPASMLGLRQQQQAPQLYQQHNQQQGTPQQRQPMSPAAARAAAGPWGPEIKLTPFVLRRWEIMADPTPNMGENDGSLGLGLFAARKVG